jgi:uncharacterized protein YbjT (DUF2867 family)
MFKDDLFLITGATGNTGAPTVEILRAAGRRVRAFVHTRDARSRYLEDLGAEVVDGELAGLRRGQLRHGGRHRGLLLLPDLSRRSAGDSAVRAGRERSRGSRGGQYVSDFSTPRSGQ